MKISTQMAIFFILPFASFVASAALLDKSNKKLGSSGVSNSLRGRKLDDWSCFDCGFQNPCDPLYTEGLFYYPRCNDLTQFVQCGNATECFIGTCASGLHWNDEKRACDYPQPTATPSAEPSLEPSSMPSLMPSTAPSSQPSFEPSAMPSSMPSSEPSVAPSSQPSFEPSAMPSAMPSTMPSSMPSAAPSSQPSSEPSATPSSMPSAAPSSQPSSEPSMMPSHSPSTYPSASPSSLPTYKPSVTPCFGCSEGGNPCDPLETANTYFYPHCDVQKFVQCDAFGGCFDMNCNKEPGDNLQWDESMNACVNIP
uniref:Circumsporozoite protein n=1 Tax=Ditylum brightwellii TaxID=49249 RepID=A0A7S4RKU9_9STRA